MADSEITRGRDPITVKITPSLTTFLAVAIGAIVSAVVWLKMIDTTAQDNTVRLRELTQSVIAMERRVQLLEWQVAHPTVRSTARSMDSSPSMPQPARTAPTSPSVRSLHAQLQIEPAPQP